MFEKIKEYFASGKSLALAKNEMASSEELKLATVIILLEVAGSDEDLAPEEYKAIFTALEKQFSIDSKSATILIAAARHHREHQLKCEDAIITINNSLDSNQKTLVFSMVWKVILADQLLEEHEEDFAKRLQKSLKITDEQSQKARQLAILKR
jgi:uncharacterized tellurite resistance protein B-like protein